MNDFSTSGVNRRRAIILSIVAAVLIIGFLMYKGLDNVVNNEIDRTVIVTGSFTCLPTREGARVRSDQGCVLGVQSRDGSYFALDISRIQDANTDLKADDTVAVTGTLRPESEINSSDWSSYDIKGIILVNTLLRTK